MAALSYDGLGRRIGKAIGNSADQNATYLEYHDGQPFGGAQGERMIELRDGSEDVFKTVGPAEPRGPSGRGVLRAERPPETCPASRAARGWAAAGPSASDAGLSHAECPGPHGFRLPNPALRQAQDGALQAGTCRPYLLKAMRRRERTGQPLGDEPLLKKIGRLLGRDLIPKKRGPVPKTQGALRR